MEGLYKKYNFAIIAMFLGFIITIQLKSNITFQGIITIPEIIDMQRQIDNITNGNTNLRKYNQEILLKLVSTG